MVCGVKRLADDIKIMAIGGIIVALALLIFDDLLFIVDNVLIDGCYKPAELIGFCPYDFFQRVFGHGLEILCHVIGRETICAFAADTRIHGI